jgi:peroxiredoxin Q/BCP
MALEVGRAAPAIELPADDGTTWRLADQAGRPVVLYFYPKDDTPGCTAQACAVRDAWADLTATGAAVVGISPDPADRHQAFRAAHDLPQVLLTDASRDVLRAYGAWGPKQRDGRTVEGVIRSSVVIAADGRVAAVRSPIDPTDQVAFGHDALSGLAGTG